MSSRQDTAAFCDTKVRTHARASLIFHARQLADCACWRAVHLRGVHTFRSIETEFADLLPPGKTTFPFPWMA